MSNESVIAKESAHLPDEGDDRKDKKDAEKHEETACSSVHSAWERINSLHAPNNEAKFIRGAAMESLRDIQTTLQEGGENDPLNLLVAYRGLEEAEHSYGTINGEDMGIAQAMADLREKIKAIEGFDIGEVENWDKSLMEAKTGVGKIIGEQREHITPEEAQAYGKEFTRYFALKQEIGKRQQEILGDSKNFYGQLSKRVFGPLVDFLHQTGEKIDEKANTGNAILQYLEHVQKPLASRFNMMFDMAM